MNSVTNVLIVGVGGQGVILASEILSEVALKVGLDAKKSEVHGMAQRGGAVSSHIRFGPKVYSPLIGIGDADVLLAFEALEAVRWAHYVREKGTILANDLRLVPPTAFATKGAKYPDDPFVDLGKSGHSFLRIPADQVARDLGNIRLANTVLLGALSQRLDIPLSLWLETIEARVPKKTIALNREAFKQGRDFLNKN
ncbi:MAG: indolepyruvate oxidoreductase subunit beta [bacterium]